MAGHSNGSRRPTTAWSRLKTVTVDPLEDMGLLSKGDSRLLDFKTQETYFKRIVERYVQYCARAGRGNALDKAFASLSLLDGDAADRPIAVQSPAETVLSEDEPYTTKELSTIMLAMRKVREAIVASSRVDAFALRAYLFIIRATILTKHMESYHPALLHLLRRIHPSSPLSVSEEHEFVGYYILDLACRQSDLAMAYKVRNMYKYKDAKVKIVLEALAHDNWYIFWNIQRSVDGYQKRLMEWVEDDMRRHALKCLGKSYLSAERMYIEQVAGRSWEQLQMKDNVGWELNGDAVTIRRIKTR